MPLLVLVLVYFVVEGYILFWVADHIGFFNTLLILGAAALLGLYIVRSQGLNAFAKANQALYRGESPHTEMLDGVVLLICGIILIIPGLLSDILALPLLIPPLRRRVAWRMYGRMAKQGSHYPSAGFGGLNHPDNSSENKPDGWQTREPGFHSDGREMDGRGGGQGPFVFYRFFMTRRMPGSGTGVGARQQPGQAGEFEQKTFERSSEYKVIVHDDEQVIDVTPENPDQPGESGQPGKSGNPDENGPARPE